MSVCSPHLRTICTTVMGKASNICRCNRFFVRHCFPVLRAQTTEHLPFNRSPSLSLSVSLSLSLSLSSYRHPTLSFGTAVMSAVRLLLVVALGAVAAQGFRVINLNGGGLSGEEVSRKRLCWVAWVAGREAAR